MKKFEKTRIRFKSDVFAAVAVVDTKTKNRGWRKGKQSARGRVGRGKREELLHPFPSSHRPPCAFHFSIFAIFIGILFSFPFPSCPTPSLFLSLPPPPAPIPYNTKRPKPVGCSGLQQAKMKAMAAKESLLQTTSLCSNPFNLPY